MLDLPDIHGPHVAPPAVGSHPIEWSEPIPRFDRERVRACTCECRARIYELRTAGGLSWIRRTDRLEPAPVVRVSPPRPAGETEKLWQMLLTGQAG